MPVVPQPPTPPAGRLWWAGWYLRSFADRLERLGRDIRNTWLIGQYLAYPFILIASYARATAEHLFRADDTVLNIERWIYSLIDGWNFINLLYWASYHFRLIRNDAKGWLRYILSLWGWRLALLVQSPWQFVNLMIREVSHWIGYVIDNPFFFVDYWLRQLRWFIGFFLDNPVAFLREFVGQIAWHVAFFIHDPLGFVRHYVRQLSPNIGLLIDNAHLWLFQELMGISYDVAQFISNPSDYIKRRVAEMFGFSPAFWSDPIYYLSEAIINVMMQRLWNFRDRLKTLAIDIILSFM